MLNVHFGMLDWGRIRLADNPVPVLELVLMLYELRRCPRRGGNDWRAFVRSAFPVSAQPLLLSVSLCDQPNVSASGADESVCRAMRDLHATCVAPLWSSVLTMFRNDVAQRTAIASGHGLAQMLNTLSPQLRLNGDVLEIASAREERIDLNGNGLILMPSAFWTGLPLITGDPQRVLIYPANHGPAGELDITKDHRVCDSLSALLGPTRAKVLRALREPHTTSSLAGEARISRSSASEHATALREAGLITSRRQGRSMHHRLTSVGRSLLDANAS